MENTGKKQLVAVLLSIVAATLIGIGSGSWCIAGGCYIAIMNVRS